MLKQRKPPQRLISVLLMAALTLTALAHDLPFPEDVNADGIVNIQDLVLVASAFGDSADPNTDVNSDEKVDILDLVRVASQIGETAKPDNSTYHEIQHHLFDKSCVNTACHGTPANAGGLNLADEDSYEHLIGQTPRNPAAAAAGMNSHYVNLLGTQPLIGETYVNLWTLPAEEVKYEAKGFTASNKEIEVPPGTTRVVEGQWRVSDAIKLLRLQGYSDVRELNVFQLTSHMHRHGELFEIRQISTGALLHRSVAYDNAPFDIFDPPIVLATGDGLRFQCTHSNYDTDQTIRYGLTSEDEMAIMFGFYYLLTARAE